MTISSTNRKAGPYSGNDVATAFPFSFKVFSAGDLYVVRADLTGAETVLTLAADYTVTLNSNQDSNPGGTITLSGALASIYTLTIASQLENLQPTDLTNQGGFYPKVITNALDRLTILIQQLAESVSRSLKTSISTPSGVSSQLPTPVAGNLLGWNIGCTAIVNYAAQAGTSLIDLAASSGSALMGFIHSAVGSVKRSVQDKLRDTISDKDFGTVSDGVTDDTANLQKAINAAKVAGLRLRLNGKSYKTSAVLDISGVSIIGLAKGYRNQDGTVITGSGGHDILSQLTATASDTRMDLQNLRIKGGACGIKVRYMLHSRWSNVHVTDCTDGVQFGNSSDAGGLFNTFENIEVDVTGTALDVNGNGFVNANSFNQCFFKGGNWGARVRCTGGLGAVGNVFNDCEFLGDRYGVELDNTSNTVFNAPYFESIGPAVNLVGTRNIGWAINNPVFALLENTNPTGKNAYIYHTGSGTQKGTIAGGYVYIPAATKYNNLNLVASESPANFYLVMEDQPEYDVSASGWTVLNGLYSPNLTVNEAKSFTPVWTAASVNPSLGNGTLTGYYTRSGNTVNATITLTAGSTTTFGTGAWSFLLPYACQNRAVGQAYILDSGTGYFGGVVMANDNNTTAEVYINGTANLVNSAAPQTWAVNDSITISLTYKA